MSISAAAPIELTEVLDDLCSRFVINISEEELQDPIRVCFALEQAHWFYLDFYRENNKKLPNLNMNLFITEIFKRWQPFHKWIPQTATILADWKKYKKSVPVCGALILNPNCTKILLVKSWGRNGIWGFPKGKINKKESNLTCAIREVREETGFDISPLARTDCLIQAVYGDQENTLFIVVGVAENTHFEPLVRKEISEIKFHKISNLNAGKTKVPLHQMIVPTIQKLKQWLKSDLGQQLRRDAMEKAEGNSIFSNEAFQGAASVATEAEKTPAAAQPTNVSKKSTNKSNSTSKQKNNDANRLMEMLGGNGRSKHDSPKIEHEQPHPIQIEERPVGGLLDMSSSFTFDLARVMKPFDSI